MTERLLVEAFSLQNNEYYEEAVQRLEKTSDHLINIIDSMQKNPEFYMKVMPIMKEERELISEKNYKDFWTKNEKILCRDFEKSAYRALLMQEIR